jgi:hypothetical protein
LSDQQRPENEQETGEQIISGDTPGEGKEQPGKNDKIRNWIIGGALLIVIAAVCVIALMKGIGALNDGTAGLGPAAVTMKGGDISLAEVQDYYDQLKAQYAENGYDITDADFLTELKTVALDELANERIAVDQINSRKLSTITDEDREKAKLDAQNEYETMLDTYAYYFQNEEGTLSDAETRQAADDFFESNSYTAETIEAQYIENLPYQRLFDELLVGVEATDDEVAGLFEERVATDKEQYGEDIVSYELSKAYYGADILYRPAGYRGVRHILLAIPADVKSRLDTLQSELTALEDELYELQNQATQEETAAPDETVSDEPTPAPSAADAEPTAPADDAVAAKQREVEAKQSEIDALIAAQLTELEPAIKEVQDKLAAGETFDALLLEYGTDPGMTEEPAKTEGYEVHADSILYDAIFHNAAMSLKNKGDISEPAASQFGVHILQYTTDYPEGAVELTSERREALRAELLEEKQSAVISAQFETWHVEYEVVTHPELIVDVPIATAAP